MYGKIIDNQLQELPTNFLIENSEEVTMSLPKVDENGKPILDEDGKPVLEEKEVTLPPNRWIHNFELSPEADKKKYGFKPVDRTLPQPSDGLNYSPRYDDKGDKIVLVEWVLQSQAEPTNSEKLFSFILENINLSDNKRASIISTNAFRDWHPEDVKSYTIGTIIRRLDRLYEFKKFPEEGFGTYPEDTEMISIYRPLPKGEAGTIADPVEFIYGMDVIKDSIYSYDNKKYTCLESVEACIYKPGDTKYAWLWKGVIE